MTVTGRDGGKNVVRLDDGSTVLWTDEELAEKMHKGTAKMVEAQVEALGGKAMTAPPEHKAVEGPKGKPKK